MPPLRFSTDLSAEILELGGNACHDERICADRLDFGEESIAPAHINHAMMNDEELTGSFKQAGGFFNFCAMLLGANSDRGSVHDIPPAMIPGIVFKLPRSSVKKSSKEGALVLN